VVKLPVGLEKVGQQNVFSAAGMSVPSFSSLRSPKWWLAEQLLSAEGPHKSLDILGRRC
jgi:hypothetical protein